MANKHHVVLLVKHVSENRSDVLDRCTDELVSAIRNSIENPENYIITNIPRRRSAIIEYGIDHSELLAKSVAKRLGARYKSLLYSNARTPQKSLERAERLKNAKFVLKRTRLPQNSSIIIVDDIITTGASMGKAASLIRSLGVKNIVAAALAVSYKDQ